MLKCLKIKLNKHKKRLHKTNQVWYTSSTLNGSEEMPVTKVSFMAFEIVSTRMCMTFKKSKDFITPYSFKTVKRAIKIKFSLIKNTHI